MKLRRIVPLDIENKILIPFACISLATVLCFCVILYFTEFQVKVEAERQEAQTLIGYLQADLQLEEYRREPERLLDKYREDYRGNLLFIYGRDGALLMGDPAADVSTLEQLAAAEDPGLGWTIRCYLDRQGLGSSFIEEQKYMILAAVAMLLAIVQASVLIAHNISDPIRRLSEVCRSISGDPGKENQLGEEYLNKTDEVGQLARAFQKMMERIRGYTGELERVKTLNESIVEKTRKIQEGDSRINFKRDDGLTKNIALIDKADIHANKLQVINQYENNAGTYKNRYDVTVLVNGLSYISNSNAAAWRYGKRSIRSTAISATAFGRNAVCLSLCKYSSYPTAQIQSITAIPRATTISATRKEHRA